MKSHPKILMFWKYCTRIIQLHKLFKVSLASSLRSKYLSKQKNVWPIRRIRWEEHSLSCVMKVGLKFWRLDGQTWKNYENPWLDGWFLINTLRMVFECQKPLWRDRLSERGGSGQKKIWLQPNVKRPTDIHSQVSHLSGVFAKQLRKPTISFIKSVSTNN
jgi:hypothetical protein